MAFARRHVKQKVISTKKQARILYNFLYCIFEKIILIFSCGRKKTFWPGNWPKKGSAGLFRVDMPPDIKRKEVEKC